MYNYNFYSFVQKNQLHLNNIPKPCSKLMYGANGFVENEMFCISCIFLIRKLSYVVYLHAFPDFHFAISLTFVR